MARKNTNFVLYLGKGKRVFKRCPNVHTDTGNIRNQFYCPDNGVLSADPIQRFNTSNT